MTENVCINLTVLYTDDINESNDTNIQMSDSYAYEDPRNIATQLWTSIVETRDNNNNIFCDVYLVSTYEILYFPNIPSIHIGKEQQQQLQNTLANRIELSIEHTHFINEHELVLGSCHIPINVSHFQKHEELLLLVNTTVFQHPIRYDLLFEIIPEQIPIVQITTIDVGNSSDATCPRLYKPHGVVTINMQEPRIRFFQYIDDVLSSTRTLAPDTDTLDQLHNQSDSRNIVIPSHQHESEKNGNTLTVSELEKALNVSSYNQRCTLSFHERIAHFKYRSTRGGDTTKVTIKKERADDASVDESEYQKTEIAKNMFIEYADVGETASKGVGIQFESPLANNEALQGMTAAQRIVESFQKSHSSLKQFQDAAALQHPQLPDDVILQDLQSIVQKEIQDLDRILLAMGISASILIIALVWTFMQVLKSDRSIGTKSMSSSGSMHQTSRNQHQSLPLEIQWNDRRNQHYNHEKSSPGKSVSSIPSLSSLPIQSKVENETSSICSRQQREWLEKQRDKNIHRKQTSNMDHIPDHDDIVPSLIEDSTDDVFNTSKSTLATYKNDTALPLEGQWNEKVKQQQYNNRNPSPCKSISSRISLESLPTQSNIENQPLSPCSRLQLEWLEKQRAKRRNSKQTRKPFQSIEDTATRGSVDPIAIDNSAAEAITIKRSYATHESSQLVFPIVAQENGATRKDVHKQKSFSELLQEKKQAVQRKSENKTEFLDSKIGKQIVKDNLPVAGIKQVDISNQQIQTKHDVTSYFEDNW